MARRRGDFDWTIARPELGGKSGIEFIADRRGSETNRQIADALSNLMGRRIGTVQVNRTATQYLTKLTAGQRTQMYEQRTHAAPVEPYGKPATRIEGDALILADCQVPYHDAAFMERCIALAVAWGVPNCVLAGDFADMQSLNSFGQAAAMPLSAELSAIRKMLAQVKRSFKRVVYICGNHEERVGRSTDGHLSFRDTLADFFGDPDKPETRKIEFSPLFWCWLGDRWIVTHPKNSSSIPARVPFQLAAKFHRHVISTHNHLWGAATDASGTFHVIDSGMCADPAKMEYYAMRHNTRPAMVQGAVIVRRGFAWHLHPTLTDWVSLKKLG